MMKRVIIRSNILVLVLVAMLLLGISKVHATNGTIVIQPIDLNFKLVDSALPIVENVEQLTFFGVEHRNTTDEDVSGDLSEGDTAIIDGVFAITGFTCDGSIVVPSGFNVTWEMTGTYVALKDVILSATDTDSDGNNDTFNYVAQPGVGILTLFVSTDMTTMANAGTGLCYDDGIMVAQFAVYEGGGAYKIIGPLDGSRDVYMLKQSGLDGFFVPDITGAVFDANLDADTDNNGVGGDVPIPTDWKYPTDGVNFPWSYYVYIDGSMRFGYLEIEEGECRMTGGGVDINKNIVLGTLASSLDDRYTYGGQIGAPTASQPQPWGEWTHHQQKGTGGRFVFHSGTASAPEGTMILNVWCMDPGYCQPARPAPFKQISWDGIGAFKNISDKGLAQLKGNGNGNGRCSEIIPGKNGTLHYYRVHVNDLGEPGSGEEPKGKGKKSTRNLCDLELTKDFPITPYEITDEQCQNCPDTYQIEIHCTEDPGSKVIYSVGAFVDGGNLQIHPPVGEHMNP